MEQPARAAVLSLHPLARLARADILDQIATLPRPEGEAAYQRPSLGPTEVSSQRPVVTLAQNLRSQPAAGGNAQPVGRALLPTVQQATPYQEHPPGSERDASRIATPCRSTCRPSVQVAPAPRTMGPKNHASAASASTKSRTKAYARKWASDGTSSVSTSVVPVPSSNSNPASAERTSENTGGILPPPLGPVEGIAQASPF
jgi:hypothetical protein